MTDEVLVALAALWAPASVPARPPSSGGRWQFAPFCFDQAIRRRPIALLEDHLWPTALATNDFGVSFWNSPTGLMLALDPVTAQQRAVVCRARAGDFYGCSIGFRESSSVGTTAGGVSTFVEVDLKEVSLVTGTPAFQETWVAVMPAADRHQLEARSYETVMMMTDRCLAFGGENHDFAAGDVSRLPYRIAQLLISSGCAERVSNPHG